MSNQVPLCSRLAARLLCVVSGAGVLLASLSCSSTSQTVTAPSASKCAIQAQPQPSSFSPAGGSGTLRITTNRECAWSVTSDASWLSLSTPREGQGEGSVPFAIAANGDPLARNAGLRINDQQVQVSQQGKPCEFEVSSRHEVLDGSGGDRTIDVEPSSTMCAWTAMTNESWITVTSGREGTGDGTVAFHVDPMSGTSRTGTVTIAGIGVGIEQRATPAPGPSCSVSIGPATLRFGASGGAGEVRVTAPPGCVWRSDSQATWITIESGASGSGPAIVGLRIAPTDGPARTGRVTIGGQIVTIEQSPGCAFTVDPASYTAPASGGASAVTVSASAGCAWTAASSASWIAITSGSAYSGSARVELSVSANTGPERTATLTIAGHAVAVRQASGCTYAVNQATLNASGAGGTANVTVTTAPGCSWHTSSGVDWMTATPVTGTGSGQAQIAIAPNLNPARTGNVTVAGQVVTVRQESQCTYSVVPSASQYSASGGAGAILVIVTGPCTWAATSSAGWIILDGSRSSGTGEGLVQFTVSANGGGPRSGTITIAGQTHSVTQAGMNP